MVLLHGSTRFHVHWLYWTKFGIYYKANSGAYILKSELYLRFLVAMTFLGVVTSIKRTLLAIHFGRRQLGTCN